MLKNHLQAKCYVVIKSKNNENTGVNLGPEFISFLNDLSASTEINIYNK